MNQPVSGSTSPRAVTSQMKECPCSLAHLCSAGTRGNRCAASKLNSLTSSTIIVQRYLVDETIGKLGECVRVCCSLTITVFLCVPSVLCGSFLTVEIKPQRTPRTLRVACRQYALYGSRK